jgi:hypothetical protein
VPTPAEAIEFSSLQNVHMGSGGQSNPLLNGYRGSVPRVMRLGCDVKHSVPPGAEVKTEWSYTSASPVCLHGVDWET